VASQNRATSRIWLTLVVAWMLALQGITSGLVTGRMLADSAFDNALLASLCTTDDARDGQPGDGEKHHAPACCTLGCPMTGSAAAPPGPFVWIAPPGASVLVDDPVPPEAGGVVSRPSASPRLPRAPPAFV